MSEVNHDVTTLHHDLTSPPSHHPTISPSHHRTTSAIRRLLETIGLFVIALLLFRAIGAEPYGVPTGSMAPALMGDHKVVVCPRCGYEVRVGHRDDGTSGRGDPHAECPNCGFDDLPLENVAVCRGDHLLVNKTVFTLRKPRRWEMVVFRCPAAEGKAFVKRVVGLPGESVQIRGGDIYIDGEIARKTLAELKSTCIPVFDNNFQPAQGWGCRWKPEPGPGQAVVEGTHLRLTGGNAGKEWQWLTYQHWNLDERKVQPVRDEYPYNGSDGSRRAEPVHDFLLECDVEVAQGQGSVAFAVTDGQEWITAEVAVGASREGTLLLGDPGCGSPETPYRRAPELYMTPGTKHHVELAFADRRATLALDGRLAFPLVDRPAVEQRAAVERPVRLGARGVEAVFSNVRIFRDVHYTEAGRHAIRAPVQLGAGQYFVLGDNSPNSDDNRFWSDAYDCPLPVPETSLLGKPFLVHLPCRIGVWEGFGGRWEYQAIDWERIRWLR
jgi:signal peptidase I